MKGLYFNVYSDGIILHTTMLANKQCHLLLNNLFL